MLLLLAACGLLTRPTPTAPPTEMPPLDIDWGTGAADMFVSIERDPPDGAAEAITWWHGPEGEKPKGATDRLGPPIGVATLLREEWAVWNVLEIDQNELRQGGDRRPIALTGGRIPDEEKRGRLVSTLYDTLLTRIEGNKALEARSGVDLPPFRLGLRVDPEVPWTTMEEVLFTAGQAQFGHQCFVGAGTYEALQQRCFELEPIPFPGRPVPTPDAVVVVRPGSAWRIHGDREERLDDSGAGLADAPALVLLKVESPEMPAGDVARWLGVIGRAGVETTWVDLSGVQ